MKPLIDFLTGAEVEVQVCRGRANLDGAHIGTVCSSSIAEVPNTALAISTTGDDTVAVGLELASRVGAAEGVEETLVVTGSGEGVVEFGVGVAGVGGCPSFQSHAGVAADRFLVLTTGSDLDDWTGAELVDVLDEDWELAVVGDVGVASERNSGEGEDGKDL